MEDQEEEAEPQGFHKTHRKRKSSSLSIVPSAAPTLLVPERVPSSMQQFINAFSIELRGQSIDKASL